MKPLQVSLATPFDIVGLARYSHDKICFPGVIVNCRSNIPSHVNGADIGWSAVAQTIKT
ncbi:hypothetical protein KEH51_27315 [[Brevibacterium] frigoritolerans]|uniref:Uncharacterized protein n=1 Tax=Peribacillus frigoritolerans TaxID=450367 RepID=A0A941FT50_9BACI|nr:hypothetical protein [Peribacillus frigoritolerans]